MKFAFTTLWRFAFVRIALGLLALLMVVGAAAYILVMRPLLISHARLLAAELSPLPNMTCSELAARARMLARTRLPGLTVAANAEPVPTPARAWLPFDRLLLDALRVRSGYPVAARSTLHALHMQIGCPQGGLTLRFEREHMFDAAPDRALIVWLAGLGLAALLLAAWLSRTLSGQLRVLAAQLRDTPLGASDPHRALSSRVAEIDVLAGKIHALRERAAGAVASRTALLMGLSHDLRTPLARTRLILDTAEPVTAADREEMQTYTAEVQQALDEFMRAANAMATAPALGSALSAWDRLRRLHDDPRILWRQAPDATAPAMNGAALTRVASNLIDNALRHGAGMVSVRLDSCGAHWRLSVCDEGPGIDPARRQALERPFVSAAAPREVDGEVLHAGLGLALIRIICEHNGWRLCLRNLRPRGFCARFGSDPELDV